MGHRPGGDARNAASAKLMPLPNIPQFCLSVYRKAPRTFGDIRSMAVEEPSLNKEGHLKYWRRCHQSFLPTPYTASDSTRLTFACFVVSALDLLSAPFTQSERNAIRTWVLSLQHPDGGFCGSSTHAFVGQNASKGTANIAATFFALILLATAADGEEEADAAFSGVQRDNLLRWLGRLQRKDGSFGQNLWEGQPVGGSDMRHSYLVSSVRWMLGAGQGPKGREEDVDVAAMISHIPRGLVCWVGYNVGLLLTTLRHTMAVSLDRVKMSQIVSQTKHSLSQSPLAQQRSRWLRILRHCGSSDGRPRSISASNRQRGHIKTRVAQISSTQAVLVHGRGGSR